MPTIQQAEIIEGPLEHPQFGRILVVRPTIDTVRAGRHPSQAVVVTTAARRMIELSKAGEKLNAVVVEGDKDPTSHPEFHEISANLRELVNKWFPKCKLTLVSRNAKLSRPETRHALTFYDSPVLGLEAGTQKTVAKLSPETFDDFKDRLTLMRRLESERLIVRTLFVRGDVDNSKDAEVRAWIKNLSEIRPAGVQILTPAKPRDGQKPVTKTRMTEIAQLAQSKVGVPVEVLSE